MTVRVILAGRREEAALLASLMERMPGVSMREAFREPCGETVWMHYDADVDAEAVRRAELEEIGKEAEP